MNTKQIMASAGLATILATGVSAHGLLRGGAGSLGGGFGGGLDGGLSGHGLTGTGGFNGQGQLNGSLPSAKKLDAKNKLDTAKTAVTEKAGAVEDRATQGVDNTSDSAGGELNATAAKDASGLSLASTANATGSPTRSAPTPTTASAPAAASKSAPATASNPVKSAPPRSLSGTADQSLNAGSHGATSDSSVDAEHSKGSSSVAGTATGSFN